MSDNINHMLQLIKRRIWDVQRFGLTPRKLLARFFNQTEPRICIISVPKAGTHLVERALCLHTRLYRVLIPTLHPGNLERFGGLYSIVNKTRPGSIVVTHLHYSRSHYEILSQAGVKGIFIIRDPRDIVVSRAFYVARARNHPYYVYAKRLSLEERLLRAIVGDRDHEFPSIRETLEWFAGWLSTDFLVVRFEDLVNENTRQGALQRMFDYLALELNEIEAQHISRKLISQSSPTFRKGQMGEWRKYLKGQLYNVFLKVAGDFLEQYGYAES